VEDCEKDIVEDDKEDIAVEYGPTVRYSGTDLQDFSRGSGNFIQVRYCTEAVLKLKVLSSQKPEMRGVASGTIQIVSPSYTIA
jgi:hypothetical protein